MSENFLQWISGFNLNALLDTIDTIITWVLDGLTNILTSIAYFITLIVDTVADITIFSTTFGSILQSVFNVIPAFYIQIVVFSILTTIILQTVRRFL